jgi:ribosome-binding protein aMBF1 (putative translation factor)
VERSVKREQGEEEEEVEEEKEEEEEEEEEIEVKDREDKTIADVNKAINKIETDRAKPTTNAISKLERLLSI